jgi:hypothetical protein
MILEISGMPTPAGDTPAARRQRLLSESDEELAERLIVLARSLRQEGASSFAPLAKAAGLPLAEVVASPFAARMVAMAVSCGATTLHTELRQVLHWSRALRGDRAAADPSHGIWDRGVLRLGKYQQFLHDEPFAAYHPDHISKWGPHELMHRASGFFCRPRATRFELYLGARLGELLPVVTWYGPEQVMRLDEGAFDRVAAGKRPQATLESALWLEEDEPSLGARALAGAALLRAGLAHAERELAAIDEEIATGRLVRVPHAFLDSSSDALAYVAGHASRLARTGHDIAALVPISFDRFEDVRAYREWIEHRFDALLFATLEFDVRRASALRSARGVWDLVHRGLQLGDRAARQLAPFAGEVIAKIVGGQSANVTKLRRQLLETLPSAAVANGDRDFGAMSVELLRDGIASCAPRALENTGDGIVPRFANSEEFWERASLAKRFAHFLAKRNKPAHAALASFEASIAAASRTDDRVEHLSDALESMPSDLERVLLCRSTAFEVAHFDRDVFALHAGERSTRGTHTYFVGAHHGEVAVISVTDSVLHALEELEHRPMTAAEFLARLSFAADPRASLFELIEAGVIAWSPRLSA